MFSPNYPFPYQVTSLDTAFRMSDTVCVVYFLSATSCVDTSSTGCRTARTWRELSSHLTSSTFLEANKSASKFGSMMLILSLYLYFTSLKGVRTAMSRSTSMGRRRSINTTSTTTCSVVRANIEPTWGFVSYNALLIPGQNQQPPQTIYSPGPRLVLLFKAGSKPGSGFKAQYRFETGKKPFCT